MAQKKFTQLTNAAALTGSEIFAMAQDGQSVQENLNTIAAFVSGSPFGNQSANLVFAGPTNGAAAAPAFRALVTADLPAGTIQDLQSVLDQGSIASISNPVEVFSSSYIQIKSTADVASLESASSGVFVGTTVTLSAGGVAYPWPSSAPAGNGYAVTVDTDGTVNFVPFTSGITIGTTTITSGTNTRVLYNNSGVVGEYAQVPVAVGGTGAATLTGLLQGNGTSAFTAISNSSTVGQVLRVTGASTYAWGALDLADSDAVTGILPIANGGTGSSSAVWWALTGTSTLTGTTTIANGGNSLTFSGTGVFTVSSTNTSTSPINFTSTYTVPAGAAVSSYGITDGGTITGKGTANDLICIHRVNGALNNSSGTGITHVSLRVDTTHGGSVNPSASIALQVLAGSSITGAEIMRGVNSSGVTRYQLKADGSTVWTTVATGTDFGGSMSTNAANGAGHILMSFQVSSSATTAHTHFGVKATGGVTTNATNNTYNSFWDNRSLVVNNTGFVGYGFRYAPVVTGTQAGTEVLYAFIAESGLSGFQATSNTPTAVVQIGAVTTDRASLRIEAGSTTTAPSSPNSGDIWHEGTGNRLMFRQGGTSIELIGTSSVNTVSATAPNRTLTVLINNTTYYIHAKTTND